MPTYLLIPRGKMPDNSLFPGFLSDQQELQVRLIVLPALWEDEWEQILLPTGQFLTQEEFSSLRHQLGASIITDDVERIRHILGIQGNDCGICPPDTISDTADV